jgi:hypothetical protein
MYVVMLEHRNLSFYTRHRKSSNLSRYTCKKLYWNIFNTYMTSSYAPISHKGKKLDWSPTIGWTKKRKFVSEKVPAQTSTRTGFWGFEQVIHRSVELNHTNQGSNPVKSHTASPRTTGPNRANETRDNAYVERSSGRSLSRSYLNRSWCLPSSEVGLKSHLPQPHLFVVLVRAPTTAVRLSEPKHSTNDQARPVNPMGPSKVCYTTRPGQVSKV